MHRVQSGESLVDTQQHPISGHRAVNPCKCNGTASDGVTPEMVCPLSPAQKTHRTFTEIEQIEKRFKSSRRTEARDGNEYSDDIEDIDYQFDYGENYTPPQQSWPTPSGINESAATSACDQAIRQSPVFTVCQNSMSNESLTSLITACKIDIQVSYL